MPDVSETEKRDEDSETGGLVSRPTEVRIYHARLDSPAFPAAILDSFLDDDDRKRAARLLRPQDGERWAAGRGLLRVLFRRHLGDPHPRLEFGPQGKPRIADSNLSFNLAHSGDRVLIAFAEGAELGVDVEIDRGARDLRGIARRFFSRAEAQGLESLPEEEFRRAFLRVWTRKEAVLKCLGRGIAGGLDGFCVNHDSREKARILAWRLPSSLGDRPVLEDLTRTLGVPAALAVAAPAHRSHLGDVATAADLDALLDSSGREDGA